MIEALPNGGLIRKLWVGETGLYRDHLLRLDADSLHTRFGAGVSRAFIDGHAAGAIGPDTLVIGFLIEGTLRGAAELRRIGSPLARAAEIALSVEKQWQSHGVGSALLSRTLLTARNRGVKSLHMQCLADNRRMQDLAAKFDASLSFETGSVIGEVDAPRSTPLSLLRELVEDGHSVARVLLDAQSRLLKAA
jgi:GNAT superfamily N-acetyltransferase